MAELIKLKWGTLKGWNGIESDAVIELLKKYHELGASMSCACHHDTPEQKQILIDLVSLPDMTIYLDWDGKYVSKDEAITYITNYGKDC